jgi:CDP-diacylglycerol--glycerol-3-phosphate 3-phosphatidyltransferase
MAPVSNPGTHTLRDLRLRWLLLAAASIFLVLGGFLLFSANWASAARQWSLLATIALAYQLIFHYPDLRLNHRTGESTPLPGFGPGTLASLSRLVCIGLLAGFLGLPRPPGALAWLPFAIYFFANINDLLDGYLARRFEHETELGAKLDMDLDGRALLLVSLLAYQYGVVPGWFLAAGAARYLFIFGLWWRRRRGLPIEELRPNPARRPLAGAQMGFTTAMLAPILGPPLTTIAAALFVPPFVGNFLYDWLQVSASLPRSFRSSPRWSRIWTALSLWLPPFLRLAAISALLLRFGQVQALPIFVIIDLMAIPAIGLGALGRLAALLALIATGFRFALYPLLPIDISLVILLTAIFFLGTGAWSLFAPEIPWANRRLGARPKP